jgi:hypothetical protein
MRLFLSKIVSYTISCISNELFDALIDFGAEKNLIVASAIHWLVGHMVIIMTAIQIQAVKRQDEVADFIGYDHMMSFIEGVNASFGPLRVQTAVLNGLKVWLNAEALNNY